MMTHISFTPSEVRQHSKDAVYHEGIYIFGGQTVKNGKNVASNNLYVLKLSKFLIRKFGLYCHQYYEYGGTETESKIQSYPDEDWDVLSPCHGRAREYFFLQKRSLLAQFV